VTVRNPMPPGRRDALLARSRGRCEACPADLAPGWEAHHRLAKRIGGSRDPRIHELSNLLALNRDCHAAATNAEPWTKANGLRVPNAGFPLAVPVLYRGRRWVWLEDDGRVVDAPFDDEQRAVEAALRTSAA